MIKRILLTILAVLALLLLVIAVNTIRYTPPIIEVVPTAEIDIDVESAATRLGEAVKFNTTVDQVGKGPFQGYLKLLTEQYPRFHAQTSRILISDYTPLYLWPGSNPDLAPILLAGHYDVVPISFQRLDDWVHPPFSGAVADGFVWGRGTLDDKGAITAILEAAEMLMAEGFQPKRSIYFSFGHDEETSSNGGAAKVAEHLISQGIELEWALDEGSFVLDGIVDGLPAPVASINVAEKGYLTVQLIAQGAGGHSSLPPTQTAVGTLAEAISKLQNAPMPGGLTGVSEEFFDKLGRHFGLPNKALFANRWLFGPVLEGVLEGSAATNAMLRTTTAPTMLRGSHTENILPVEAAATINFRLHPRDSVEDVIAHIERVVDDERVRLEPKGSGSEASPVSDHMSEGYVAIRNAILANFGEVITVPGLTIAATDARHYAKAAKNTFRINPFQITSDDLTRFHGLNERLSLENLERGIGFYHTLMSGQ